MKKRPFLTALFTLALAAAPAAMLSAQPLYSGGHGDIGVEYTPGETEFEPHWHLGAGAVVDGLPLADGAEFSPDEIQALVLTERAAPSGSGDWLGVTPGSTVWRTGDSANPPNLGFAAEEVGDSSDWLDGVITITLSGWGASNPGEVALLQTVSGFGTFVWFSTFDAAATQNNNMWSIGVGAHEHLTWLFSAPGYYELEFTWSGTYVGDGGSTPVSGTGTFGMQVAPVPEPATWGMIMAGGLVALAVLRRRALRVK